MMNNLSEVFSVATLMIDSKHLSETTLARSLDDLLLRPATSPFDLQEVVVRRSLDSITAELRSSIQQFRLLLNEPLLSPEPIALPPPSWSMRHEIQAEQFRQAVLEIDLFPRCVLLLTTFLGLSVSRVARLVNVDAPLVQAAQSHGLRHLAGNVAAEQGFAGHRADQRPPLSRSAFASL